MARRLAPALACAVFTAATLTTTGCGPLMRFIGDKVADAITQKTADLSDASAAAYFTTGLYPADARTIETEVLGEKWVSGGSMINVNFLKRRGVGMWEIDGSVTARKGPKDAPVPLAYYGKGAYGLLLPPGDRAPRTIEVKTTSGQTLSFQLKPAAPVKLKAVGGKAKGASVDLAKDLVLELDEAGPGKLKVMLAATTLGIRTMTDLAICKPAKRLVIPAAAYKHMGVSASMAGIVGVDTGANYVVVERYDAAALGSPKPAGAAFTVGRSWSSVPVTVEGDAKNVAALTVTGKVENSRGELNFSVSKPQAFYSPPLSRARRIAIGSLFLRGRLYKQTSSSSQSYGPNNTVITTTTTTTLAFPRVAPQAWDGLTEDAAQGLIGAFRATGSGATLVPPERLLNSPLYQGLDEAADEVTDKLVERAWRKTRHVNPTSAASALASISSTFALDRPVVRLMNEAGADALLSATVDLNIGTLQGTDKIVLVPSMSFSLAGANNGYTVGPTTFASGTVQARDGVAFSKAELEDEGALRRIVRLDDLFTGLRGALEKLRETERAQGYDAIWALQ